MFKFFRTIPFLLALGVLQAQDIGPGGYPIQTEDLRDTQAIACALKTVGHFNIQKMDIPFQLVNTQVVDASWSGSEQDAAYAAMVRLILTCASAGSSGSFSNGSQFVDWFMGKASSDTSFQKYLQQSRYFVATTLQAFSDNTERRIYTFYVPTPANYSFNVSFKGSLIKPRNRFAISSSTGQIFYAEDNPSNDETLRYTLHLDKGYYNAVVGLGSGASVAFHSAGTLNGILLDEPATIQFDLPMVVAVKTNMLTQTMPGVGSKTVLSVSRADIEGVPAYPNWYQGSLTLDQALVEPLPSAYLSPAICQVPSNLYDGPFWVYTTLAGIGEYAPHTWDGNTASYFVIRKPDSVLKTMKNRSIQTAPAQ